MRGRRALTRNPAMRRSSSAASLLSRTLGAFALTAALAGNAGAQIVPPGAREFGIARLKYGGGGDWYEDRTSLTNLLHGLHERTSIPIAGDHEAIVEPGAAALFQYPFVFACGHGNIKFTPDEVENLRRYLTTGGLLW